MIYQKIKVMVRNFVVSTTHLKKENKWCSRDAYLFNPINWNIFHIWSIFLVIFYQFKLIKKDFTLNVLKMKHGQCQFIIEFIITIVELKHWICSFCLVYILLINSYSAYKLCIEILKRGRCVGFGIVKSWLFFEISRLIFVEML